MSKVILLTSSLILFLILLTINPIFSSSSSSSSSLGNAKSFSLDEELPLFELIWKSVSSLDIEQKRAVDQDGKPDSQSSGSGEGKPAGQSAGSGDGKSGAKPAEVPFTSSEVGGKTIPEGLNSVAQGAMVKAQTSQQVHSGESEQIWLHSSDGSPFRCSIPVPPAIEEIDESQIDMGKVSANLKDFFTGRDCFMMSNGYFQYEFCYNQHVRQFHRNQQGKITLHFFLGLFRIDPEESERFLEQKGEFEREELNQGGVFKTALDPAITLKYEPSPKGRKVYYVSQNYTHGSRCDLTNQPRQVEVRFKCNPLVYGMSTIEEVETCKYVATFFIHTICEFPGFQTPAEVQNNIECKTTQPDLQKSNFDKAINELLIPPTQLGPKIFQKTQSDVPLFFQPPVIEFRFEGSPKFDFQQGSNQPPKFDSQQKGSNQPPKKDDPKALPLKEIAESLPIDELKSRLAKFLDANLKNRCLDGKMSDYWSYTYCYKAKVTQFHLEGDKKTWEIGLGKYNSQIPDKITKIFNNKQFAYNQEHTDGFFCEEIKDFRKISIRFVCMLTKIPPVLSLPSEYSLILEEKSTCVYQLTVSTPLMCPENWESLLKDKLKEKTEVPSSEKKKDEL